MIFRKNQILDSRNIQKHLDSLSLESINGLVPEILRKQGKGWGSTTTNEEVSALISLVETIVDEEMNFFDIGANVGLYTQAILELLPKAKIFSFEPSSKAFAILSEKYSSNQKVTLINSAVGMKNGSSKLYSDESGSGMASLTKRRMEHFGMEFEFEEEISLVKLDDWCWENNVWPSIIKMDVEGHELDVLKSGSEAVLKADAIQFEFGGCNIDTRTFFQDFWYFFKENKFDIWRITPTGLDYIQNYSEYDECFTTTNYLAINKIHKKI